MFLKCLLGFDYLPTYLLINGNYTKGRVGNTVTFSYSFSEAEFLLAYFFSLHIRIAAKFFMLHFSSLKLCKVPYNFPRFMQKLLLK